MQLKTLGRAGTHFSLLSCVNFSENSVFHQNADPKQNVYSHSHSPVLCSGGYVTGLFYRGMLTTTHAILLCILPLLEFELTKNFILAENSRYFRELCF